MTVHSIGYLYFRHIAVNYVAICVADALFHHAVKEIRKGEVVYMGI